MPVITGTAKLPENTKRRRICEKCHESHRWYRDVLVQVEKSLFQNIWQIIYFHS